MKTANLNIAALEVECPHCLTLIEDKSGSFMWSIVDLPVSGEPQVCPNCGKTYEIPDNYEWSFRTYPQGR